MVRILSLQRGVRCEPDFRANPIDDRPDFANAKSAGPKTKISVE